MRPGQPFTDLPALAAHLRSELENKKTILLYAYNGTGKTRLSMAFKDMGKQAEARDTRNCRMESHNEVLQYRTGEHKPCTDTLFNTTEGDRI